MVQTITEVFLKETLNAAAQDLQKAMVERIKQRDGYVQNLWACFDTAHASGDRTVTLEEVQVIVEFLQLKSWLLILS